VTQELIFFGIVLGWSKIFEMLNLGIKHYHLLDQYVWCWNGTKETCWGNFIGCTKWWTSLQWKVVPWEVGWRKSRSREFTQGVLFSWRWHISGARKWNICWRLFSFILVSKRAMKWVQHVSAVLYITVILTWPISWLWVFLKQLIIIEMIKKYSLR